MTDDIVTRLRTWSADESTWDLLTEAADEIERLRAALREIAASLRVIAVDALRPGERINHAKEASDDAAT